jgi:hypothetical protein
MNPAAQKLLAALAFLTILVATACAASFAPTYKEPPCGYTGHSCPNTDHMCCDESYDCGGNVEFMGCPAGSCCYNGGLAAPRDSGTPAPAAGLTVPQRAAHR